MVGAYGSFGCVLLMRFPAFATRGRDIDGNGVDLDGSGSVSLSGSDALNYQGVAEIVSKQR